MSDLHEAQRNNAIGRLEAGHANSFESNRKCNVCEKEFRLNHNTSQLMTLHFNTVKVLFFVGINFRSYTWSPTIGPTQDMYIRLRHLWERFTAASSNASAIPGGLGISDQSVHNRLREAGITARRLVNK
jgi:hypothetical protein